MDSILMRSKAHDGSVCCANFSPDDEVIVSAGEDENIKVMPNCNEQKKRISELPTLHDSAESSLTK